MFMIKPGQFYPEAQALCPYLPQNSPALPLNTSLIYLETLKFYQEHFSFTLKVKQTLLFTMDQNQNT